jgi:hypothetical protein
VTQKSQFGLRVRAVPGIIRAHGATTTGRFAQAPQVWSMRPVLALLLCLAVTGCQCGGTDTPTPVTFRIRNTTSQDVFVDATDQTVGLRVQRRVGDAWFTFVEAPPCPCLACEAICDGCTECNQAEPIRRVQRIPPGESLERAWTGFVQVDQTASCRDPSGELQSCLQPEVPPLDETFRLQFCYGASVPGVGSIEPGVAIPGVIPDESVVCVQQEFTVSDGTVEVGPKPSPPCTMDLECPAPAVCLESVCTTTCTAHGFPSVGGTWQVRVLAPEEQGVPGFFVTSTGTGNRRISVGTGTLTSVRYSNGTMTLQLARAAVPAGEYKATLSIAVPAEAAVALKVGEQLSVRVVDASTSSLPENRALTLRDARDNLLLAADPALLGAVLGPDDIRPFTAVATLAATVGCEDTSCGKRSFRRTEFRVGTAVLALKPGESEEVVATGATWFVLNLSNSGYRSTSCSLKSLMPYVLVNRRVSQGP